MSTAPNPDNIPQKHNKQLKDTWVHQNPQLQGGLRLTHAKTRIIKPDHEGPQPHQTYPRAYPPVTSVVDVSEPEPVSSVSTFETNADGWTLTAGATRSTARAYAGTYSLKFDSSNSTNTATRTFTVGAGSVLSYYVYIDYSYWMDALTKVNGTNVDNYELLTQSTWHLRTVNLSAGENIIQFYNKSDSENDVSKGIWIDNITVTNIVV